jgi:uncharacterized phiE125 gp8 family phage protein
VSLILISPPVGTPISLQEARAQCRVDDASEDALLSGYVRSATEHVENITGLKLLDQTWEWTVDAFPDRCGWLRLPLAPLLSIVQIVYQNEQGTALTLDPMVYLIRGLGDAQPAQLILVPNQECPSTWHGHGAVIIRARYGWMDHNSVPEAIRQALAMLVAYWFNQREAAVIGPDYGPVSDVPYGVKALLEPYRVWSV